MVTLDNCNVAIPLLGMLALVDGVFTGYCFHEGLNNEIFVPLIVGFVFVVLMFYFIQKKDEIKSGKKVDDY